MDCNGIERCAQPASSALLLASTILIPLFMRAPTWLSVSYVAMNSCKNSVARLMHRKVREACDNPQRAPLPRRCATLHLFVFQQEFSKRGGTLLFNGYDRAIQQRLINPVQSYYHHFWYTPQRFDPATHGTSLSSRWEIKQRHSNSGCDHSFPVSLFRHKDWSYIRLQTPSGRI